MHCPLDVAATTDAYRHGLRRSRLQTSGSLLGKMLRGDPLGNAQSLAHSVTRVSRSRSEWFA